MKFNEPIHVENFLRSRGDYLLKATTDYKPMQLMKLLDNYIRRFETDNFQTKEEKKRVRIEAWKFVIKIFEDLRFNLPFADHEKIRKSATVTTRYGVLPILRTLKNAFEDIYNNKSKYWNYVYRNIGKDQMPTSTICETFRDANENHPTHEEAAVYIDALTKLDEHLIEEFENMYDVTVTEKFTQYNVFPFLSEINLEILAETGIAEYTGKTVSIDSSLSKKFAVLGMTGCLSEDTKIFVDKDKTKSLKDIYCTTNLFDILSFNMKEKKIEWDRARIINSGKKELFRITTTNGKTINASEDHIFFVLEDNKVVEKRLKDMKKGDKLLCAKKGEIDAA